MRPYRLPLKFIGLWALNVAILLALGFGLGINDYLIHTLHMSVARGLAYLYLGLGAVLAVLEEALINKLQGNE